MGKIIEVYPCAGKTLHTAPVWQYDYGQMLHVNGIDLPVSYKAEFSNTTRGNTVSTVQTTDEITIPAQYLESGAAVYIWLVVVDEQSRTTEYALIVPVAARAKPTDEEPTPEEQSEIDQTLAALNSGISWVEGIAESIPDTINDALEAAKESGEFDGADGKDGQDGKDGKDGADGFSPTATVNKTGGTSTITITDKNGTTTTTVIDGQNGANGKDGKDGAKGDTGDSGVYYGETAPSDPKVNVWIKPNGNPEVPVTDVRANGVSLVTDFVANMPIATYNDAGLVKAQSDYGIGLNPKGDGGLRVEYADDSIIKKGTGTGSLYKPIVPYTQHYATFYGLAKAAGADMSSSPNSIGNYTDSAKSLIQIMLGIASIIGKVEGATASKPYAVGELFLYGGMLCKATSAIPIGAAIVPGANCEQTTIIDALKGV